MNSVNEKMCRFFVHPKRFVTNRERKLGDQSAKQGLHGS